MLYKIRNYLARYLKAKKVVVISQDEIVSISLGPLLQVILFCGVMLLTGWVSYSSGKYFLHENILDAKEQQINYTAQTNQTLRVQMTDLYQNLEKLDNYFERLEKYDHIRKEGMSLSHAAESDDSEGSAPVERSSAVDVEEIEGKASITLSAIGEKVQQRVMRLENVFQVAGINLEKFKRRDSSLDGVYLSLRSQSPQGGPYHEANGNDLKDPFLLKLQLEHNINYLLYLEGVINELPLIRPMKSGYVSSSFGYRVDPIRKKKAMHRGIDFVGSYRAKVYSTAPGRVVKAGLNGAYGKFIEIDHGQGVSTRYGHLSKIKVQKGQLVVRDQLIALQGNTGRSTGAHLHYEIRYNGTALNPYNFLKAGEYVFKS